MTYKMKHHYLKTLNKEKQIDALLVHMQDIITNGNFSLKSIGLTTPSMKGSRTKAPASDY